VVVARGDPVIGVLGSVAEFAADDLGVADCELLEVFFVFRKF
jgi:hypothetical protein